MPVSLTLGDIRLLMVSMLNFFFSTFPNITANTVDHVLF